MPDLEKQIAQWRRQMLAAGIKSPAPLEELESHLREDIDILRSSGVPEALAFEVAVSRLGTSRSLQREFNKVERTSLDFVTIALFAWTGAMILFAVLLSSGLFSGRLSFLLFAHIFSLTVGYCAALLTGGFGIYYVCGRLCLKSSMSCEQSLSRAVVSFTRVAAGLVAAGLLLGTLWSKPNLGRYWGADPREIGTLCALVWIITAVIVQRFCSVSDRATMLMGIGGNIIVGLAWFGSGIVGAGSRSYGLGSHWPLAIFIGIHFVFLMMGGVPLSSVRLKRS